MPCLVPSSQGTLSNCNTPKLEKFLYILKEHVENNLFVKYYVRMANFNKVIKVLNIKSVVSLQWTSMGSAIETTHSMVIECVVSIAIRT